MNALRRHKCEFCGVIYICMKCTDWCENWLLRVAVGIKHQGGRTNTMMTSPECMREFICFECEEIRENQELCS